MKEPGLLGISLLALKLDCCGLREKKEKEKKKITHLSML